MQELSLSEAIFSTRAMRRLKPDPVSEEDLRFIVEAATQAASGENAQPWSFVIVRDPELRRQLAGVYRDVAEEGLRQMAEREDQPDFMRRIYGNAMRLAERIGDAPVHVVVCMKRRPPDAPPIVLATWYGSIFPAIQNLMLAARGRGLGTTLTTLHLGQEERAKQILGIPDHLDTVALIPVGWPSGRFGRPVRRPAWEVTHWDRWGERRPPADGDEAASA